jgi:RNA polymerase-interacting CarD/CdnL/TRCF family regulator
MGNKKRYIMIELHEKDRDILVRASKIFSIGLSSFCRIAGLEKAREILNKMEVPQTA